MSTSSEKNPSIARGRKVMLAVFMVAVAGLIVGGLFLVHEARRGPNASAVTTAAPPGEPPPGRRGPPRFAPGSQPAPVAEIPIPPERQLPPVVRIPPRDMPDPAHPPQFTKPLAEPNPNPVPPDPFVPPPMVQDPNRGREPPQ
jgi:hypothetical protein